ncbi:MAG: LLM class flavin-dependent oxidoreductase [Acidimicrobiales bacterium]|nr:LLM class flavin-dependent oxidoreductase [Acidimicrobiales bacterium]
MVDLGLLSLLDVLADPATGVQPSTAQRYHGLVRMAVTAEEAGFCALGVGEHHFSHYALPSPFLVLSHAAAATKTIELGTSVTLLANADPVRIAEDLATLDVLSDGRAEATFARGVDLNTMHAFGIESIDELRPRFEEHLRLVLRLLTEEEVTWEGNFRAPLDKVHLEPRPVQQPHPRINIGGGLSTVSADLAGDLGLPFVLPSLFRFPDEYRAIVDRYRERMIANGFGDKVSVTFPCYLHVAPTSQEARRRWQPYFENYVQFASMVRSAGARSFEFDTLIEGPAVCGSPAEAVERLAGMAELLGLDRLLVLIDAGGIPMHLVDEVLSLVGAEVIPALRRS